MKRWEPVQAEIVRFQQRMCSPAMPALTILHATDKQWSKEDCRAKQPKGFPSKLRGVYLLYDDAEILRYVGVAMWNFAKRPVSHDDWIERRYTDIVPFDEAWLSLALALEFWLIQTIPSLKNTAYRGYGIGDTVGHDPIPNPANEAKG